MIKDSKLVNVASWKKVSTTKTGECSLHWVSLLMLPAGMRWPLRGLQIQGYFLEHYAELITTREYSTRTLQISSQSPLQYLLYLLVDTSKYTVNPVREATLSNFFIVELTYYLLPCLTYSGC